MADDEKKQGMDAEKIKEILAVVSDKVPALLTNLADVLYGKEQGAKYGQAVAGFYKSLKDAGMTDDQAYELTRQYMSAMNLPSMIGQAMRGGMGKKKGPSAELGEKSDDDEQ